MAFSLDTFAKRLVAARQAKGLTQKTLAHAVGTYQGHIYRLERGEIRERVSIAVLQQIPSVLGVSLDWLIAGIEASPQTEEPLAT